MAAKLSLLSLAQPQQLPHSEQIMTSHQSDPAGSGHSQWVWSYKLLAPEELDNSWEVRAFAEDYTGGVSGSTWPPRSYTCTFCKREFRSAQALGGHMNVHRRDRATRQLHHHLPPPTTATAAVPPSSPSLSSTLTSERDLANFNGGFCLLCHLPPESNAVIPGNWCPAPASFNLPVKHRSSAGSSQVYSSKTEVASAQISNCLDVVNVHGNWNKDSAAEDLDLELRLGHRPFSS